MVERRRPATPPWLRSLARRLGMSGGQVRARAAAIIGAVALGIGAVLFARGGDLAQALFAGIVARWWWAPLILTPAVFVGVVALTRAFAPAARGSGIPQVIAAAKDPDRADPALLSPKTALAKLSATLAMLAVGASVGREGPTVQVSAAILAWVQRRFSLPVSNAIVIAGGAAGVAAAFNTPLAGVAFAIEELANGFEQRVAGLVMAAVMVSGLVSLGLAGDYVYFGAMSEGLSIGAMIVVAPVAGVLGGIAGGLFSRALLAMAFDRTPWLAWVRARPLWLAAGCGLVVAGVGVATHGVSWGTGYGATRRLLAGGGAPLTFGPAKLVATLATAISGAPGGIFAPSLSVGAGLGQWLSLAFPHQPAGAVVLLGMIGYFTGVVRAPLTASIIVMEMTADRSMVLPLFATALIADWASALVCRRKLYHTLAKGFGSTRALARGLASGAPHP